MYENLSQEEKQRDLFERQKTLLATFLEHGAISQEQHDKSLHDMAEKMGFNNSESAHYLKQA